MAGIFKIGISRNTKCDILVGFPKSGHNLNLAVTNAMKEEDRITKAVGVCKKVVLLFAHGWKKEIALQRHKFQKGFFIICLLLIALLCRWGSQHSMISRIIKQDATIHMVLSDDRKTT